MHSDTMDVDAAAPRHGAPNFEPITAQTLRDAVRRGWDDVVATPGLGFAFSAFYVVFGWAMIWITQATGTTYWLVLAAAAFPLLGPFAAIGYYDISRKRARGEPVVFSEVASVIWRQRDRQLPWLCAVIVVLVLFWFFVGHMIFALFLGLSPMVNVSSSLEVYLSQQGLMMLAFGSAVGAAFAILLFMMTVFALPMLLDREVDFVTAMIQSIGAVQANLPVMLSWGLLVAVMTFVAMMPGLLGLFLVLPLLGHATWHLYDLATPGRDCAEA